MWAHTISTTPFVFPAEIHSYQDEVPVDVIKVVKPATETQGELAYIEPRWVKPAPETQVEEAVKPAPELKNKPMLFGEIAGTHRSQSGDDVSYDLIVKRFERIPESMIDWKKYDKLKKGYFVVVSWPSLKGTQQVIKKYAGKVMKKNEDDGTVDIDCVKLRPVGNWFLTFAEAYDAAKESASKTTDIDHNGEKWVVMCTALSSYFPDSRWYATLANVLTVVTALGLTVFPWFGWVIVTWVAYMPRAISFSLSVRACCLFVFLLPPFPLLLSALCIPCAY